MRQALPPSQAILGIEVPWPLRLSSCTKGLLSCCCSPHPPLNSYVFPLRQIIRYPWYAATLVDSCPAWLTWLRYTAFIVLYPIGVVSEVWILVEALPSVKVQSPSTSSNTRDVHPTTCLPRQNQRQVEGSSRVLLWYSMMYSLPPSPPPPTHPGRPPRCTASGCQMPSISHLTTTGS